MGELWLWLFAEQSIAGYLPSPARGGRCPEGGWGQLWLLFFLSAEPCRMLPFSRLRGKVPEEPAPAKAGGGWGELWLWLRLLR